MYIVGWVLKLAFLCLSSILQKVDSHHDDALFEATAFGSMSDLRSNNARSEQVYDSNISHEYSESSRLSEPETISGPDNVNKTDGSVQEKKGGGPLAVDSVNWDETEVEEVDGRHQKVFAIDTSDKVLSNPVDNSKDKHAGFGSAIDILNDQVEESSLRDTDDNPVDKLVSGLNHDNEENLKDVLKKRYDLRSITHRYQPRSNDLESPMDSSYLTFHNESELYHEYPFNSLPYVDTASKHEPLRTTLPYSYMAPTYPSLIYTRNNNDYSDLSQELLIYKYPSLSRKRDGLPTFYPPDYHPPFPHYHYPVPHHVPMYPFYPTPLTNNNYPPNYQQYYPFTTYNPNFQHHLLAPSYHSFNYKPPELYQHPYPFNPPYSPRSPAFYQSHYPFYHSYNLPNNRYNPQPLYSPYHPYQQSYYPQPSYSHNFSLRFPYLFSLLRQLIHSIQRPHLPYEPHLLPYNPLPPYFFNEPTTPPLPPYIPDPSPDPITEQNPYYSDQSEQVDDEEPPNQSPQPPYQPPQSPYQPLQPPYQPPQPPYQPPQPPYQPSQPPYQPPQPPYQPPQPPYQSPQPPYQPPQPPYQPPQSPYLATQTPYQPPQPPYEPLYQPPQLPYEPPEPQQQPTRSPEPPYPLTQPPQLPPLPPYQPTLQPYPPTNKQLPPYLPPNYPAYYQTSKPLLPPYYQTPPPTQPKQSPQPPFDPLKSPDPPRDPNDPNTFTSSDELESRDAVAPPALKKRQRKKNSISAKGRVGNK